MSTLIERIQQLSEKINLLSNSQVTEDEATAFRTRAEELSQLSNNILVPAKLVELFRARGIMVETPVTQSRQLKDTIDEKATQYHANPRSILTSDVNWRHVTRPRVAQLTERVDEELSVAWRNHVSKIKPTIDQGLMIVLRSSPAYAAHADQVHALSSGLDQLANRLPRNLEDINRPEALATALIRATENLPTDIPEPVRELFVAINRRTATAGHLTDEAIAWLREREMLDTIAVSWRFS